MLNESVEFIISRKYNIYIKSSAHGWSVFAVIVLTKEYFILFAFLGIGGMLIELSQVIIQKERIIESMIQY